VRREPSAVLLAHVRDPVPEASAIAPGLPAAVDEVLARGLAKEPRERPESAQELVAELRGALGALSARPAAVAVGAGGGGGDPWDAALTRFGDETAATSATGRASGTGGYVPVPERLTQAFGDASRRRGAATKRDLLIAGGVAAAILLLTAGVGGWILGASSADASGAKAEGYAAGVAAGKAAGTTAGTREGRIAGKREGLAQGRATGFAAGK
jgi:serine/threonine-protein kinase